MEANRYNKKIPKATSKRLPVYLRYLKMLDKSGVHRIKSREFSELTQIPSATIRRDFSHLGELGRSGYGYEVSYLIEVFSQILHSWEEKRIALVGCGNLGKALLYNNFRRNENVNIVCAFDNDPKIIGTEIAGLKICSMADLDRQIADNNCTVAISTVPSEHSQAAIDQLVKAGVTAILNFAPNPVNVPANVVVQYLDLTTELLTMIYYNDNYINKVNGAASQLTKS